MGAKLCESTYGDGSHHAWVFHCPGCGFAHHVDKRWSFNGNQEKPTFGPVSPSSAFSLLIHGNPPNPETGYAGSPRCHSFVKDGMIAFERDSTHALAGQTVEIPDWPGWKVSA